MINYFLVVFSVFFLLACAPVSVEHEGKISSSDQPVKATYSWLEQAVPSNDMRVNNPTIEKMVRQSVEKHLRAKGYEKSTSGEADYLITWFGKIDEEVKEISMAAFYSQYGYGTLIGDLPEKVENGKVRKVFSRGTLVVDVLDRQNKNVLWRGSATNTLREGMNKQQIAEYIYISIGKILEQLP